MRTLTRTIILLIALNMITADIALAQSATFNTVPEPVAVANTSRALRPISSLSMGRRSVGTGNTVLVIPTQEIKTEELLAINEDMNVMSRIFGNELNQTRLTSTQTNWMFTGENWAPGFWGRGDSMPQGMYLQGYGALFLMKVDFPLSAQPDIEEQEEQKTEKEDVDQIWQQTRQQIYEPQETSRSRRGAERDQVKFDPQKVENLKTTLIKALKHAANIRVLKPDESLILSITGSGASSNVVGIMTNRTDQIMVIEEAGGKQISRVYEDGLPNAIKLSSPTALVIRAKKSDIDSFAKGELDLDKFRQRVAILSYPLLGTITAGTSTSLVLPTATRSTGTR